LLRLWLVTGQLQQERHRCTQAYFPVTGLLIGVTGHGGDAADQRRALVYRLRYRGGGSHVLTDNAEVGGNTAGRDFLTGEDLNQLLFATGRVFGRDTDDINMMLLMTRHQRGIERFNRLRLIVFDTNHATFGADNLQQNLGAGDDLVGAFAHQHVIGGDVWLAFGTVENQRVDGALTGVQFHRSGKARTAHAGNATLTDVLNQLVVVEFGQVLYARFIQQALALTPAVFAITLDDDAQFFQA